MENISSKAELSERYTNHCIRASTITALYQRGVDAKQICAITKHKDERSLSHYILKLPVNKNGNAPGFCKKRFMDIRPHKPLKTHVRQHIPKAKIPAGLEKSLQFRKHCRIIFSL